MNEQELYQKAENARRDATPVHQRSIDEIVTSHMALQARVAELEAALDNIGNMAYTALHLHDGEQHCTMDEFRHACVQILDTANEAAKAGAE